MQSAYIRALLLSIVMVSGLFLSSIGVEAVFAEKGGEGKAQGDPKGCYNGKGKDGGANPQNPNCVEGSGSSGGECDPTSSEFKDFDEDGICDAEDFCPSSSIGEGEQTRQDKDGDGVPNHDDGFPCNPTVS